jgi:hypothetical protein
MKVALACVTVLFAALLGLSGCTSSGTSVVSVAAENEFGSGVSSCPDTIAIAADCGVDYEATVEMALKRDSALARLFWLSAYGGFDAASSQGHAAVIGELLRQIGDHRFGRVLTRQCASVREAVWRYIEYDYGCNDAPESVATLHNEFPLTFAG